MLPRDGTGWYKLRAVEYTLLSISSENVQIEPFADKLRQELLSGCIQLGPM